MRVVLYADDMEPITVLELPEPAYRSLEQIGMVRLAVMLPPMLSWLAANEPPSKFDSCKTVTIFSEMLVRKGKKHMMLFTNDEENSLLLKSAFLPGQHKEVQERERAAFAHGFLEALSKVGYI